MIDFNKIKSAVSIQEAASFYGIDYDKHTKKCCCLFHNDKHPSMMLNKDYYYCFSCGAHGDVINLVQQHFGLSLIDAAKKLIMDFNLDIPIDTYESPSLIRQRQREIEQRKEMERAFAQIKRDALFTLHKYHGQLLAWKRDLVPEDMNLDNANPLFLEALNNFDYVDSMIDELTYGTTSEQIAFMKNNRREIEKIEERISELY